MSGEGGKNVDRVCVMSLKQGNQGLIGPRWKLLRGGGMRWEAPSTPIP